MKYATTELDLEMKASHVADAIRAFSEILQDLRSSSQGQTYLTSTELPEKKREDLQKSFIRDNRDVKYFLNEFISSQSHSSVVNMLMKIIFKGKFEDSMLQSLKALIEAKFELEMIGISQVHMNESITSEMMKYIPKRLIVDVDPSGKISQVSDLFDNESKDVQAKIKAMRILIDKYNSIVERVKKDLKSTDVNTKMKAVILMIVLETGVRPGGVGTSNLKDESGRTIYDEENEEPIKVNTFGASALNLSSISKVLSNAVEFTFKGKSSTTNYIRVTQPEVVKIIVELAQSAEVGRADLLFGEKFLFKNANGNIIDNSSLNTYLKKVAGGEGLVLTDFRKLKATQSVFDHLRNKQKALLSKIKQFVVDEVEDLSDRVAQEVSQTIGEAIESAKVALNHSDTEVTIEKYINPLVVMRYLSEGGFKDDLQQAILTNPTHLKFDPQTFINRAMNIRTSSQLRVAFIGWSRKATLLDTIEDLEDSISERSSNILETMMELEERIK